MINIAIEISLLSKLIGIWFKIWLFVCVWTLFMSFIGSSLCCFKLDYIRFCTCFAIVWMFKTVKLCARSSLKKPLAPPISKMAPSFKGDRKLLTIASLFICKNHGHCDCKSCIRRLRFIIKECHGLLRNTTKYIVWIDHMWRWIHVRLIPPSSQLTTFILIGLQPHHWDLLCMLYYVSMLFLKLKCSHFFCENTTQVHNIEFRALLSIVMHGAAVSF